MAIEQFSERSLLEHIAGLKGSMPTSANTGLKTFSAPAMGLTTREAVTISRFLDSNGVDVTTGWETVALASGETIWFIVPVSAIVTTTGGLVQYYVL